ncbi:MAG TPA: prepilin-type N-terminal cleavage/methylation domain-containing protein [Coleofasciculaceae cyanobacterium]|jgi:prepilin-type N-terminal cleavage/methylation domain-containing protein
MLHRASHGFTLAELLIALMILGEIATFTIPKVLSAQQDQSFRAKAKEAAGMITDAMTVYQRQNGLSSATTVDELTQYMNYVKVTTTLVDDNPGQVTTDCSAASFGCLLLHNGGVLVYQTTTSFSGTGSTNAIWFDLDPDGKVTGGANDAGTAVQFALYYNGRLTSGSNVLANTVSSTYTFGPADEPDPPWFSWN